ncbi:MAG TPA: class I SAM-dependent methyltransferase [Ktedonobacteraceae bacterium]
MSMIETEETNQFTFEAFASHNFYTEVNRSLVRHALASIATRPLNSPLTIVDMACGTGAVTRLIAEEIASQGRQAYIIGVDPSAEALRRARKGMEGVEVKANFIQGETSDLPNIVQNADAAFFCNAIHLLSDKLSAFRLIASILAPDGIFACNSAFYNGTYVEGTERFYRLWTRRAVGWLRKEHPEAHLSREAKATAMQQIDREGYICLLKEGGFCRVDAVEEQAMMTMDSYRDIGQYWLFIEGALPGIPLALGAEALRISAYQAGAELGLKDVPRNWLQIIAHKM